MRVAGLAVGWLAASVLGLLGLSSLGRQDGELPLLAVVVGGRAASAN